MMLFFAKHHRDGNALYAAEYIPRQRQCAGTAILERQTQTQPGHSKSNWGIQIARRKEAERMATDFISREAAEQVICEACERPGCQRLWGHGCNRIGRLNKIPAADVRPVDEISDSVDEAIDYLSSVSNQIPYHVYSALFDLICGICPTCGTKVKEIGGSNARDYELLTSESSKELTSADKHFRKVTAAELAKFIKRHCQAIMGDDAVIEVEANGAAHINAENS